MKPLFIFFRFIRFFFQATTAYRVHSPFVFEFIKNVLEDKRSFYSFGGIESIRRKLYQNKESIEVTDFGAGSQVIKSRVRKIKSMAKSSLTPAYYCQILFRIVHHYKPQTILELGTSFGVSTLYQALPDSRAKVITLEGCPHVARIAQQHFKIMEAKNIQLINGPFDQVLPNALKDLEKLDYVFIDGNHRKEPTLRYFEQCLQYAHNDSIFIFHDIHWTTDMEAAWAEIQQHPQVQVTIDLFFMGIVFFRKEQKEKEHFKLLPIRWKPWVMGFFE